MGSRRPRNCFQPIWIKNLIDNSLQYWPIRRHQLTAFVIRTILIPNWMLRSAKRKTHKFAFFVILGLMGLLTWNMRSSIAKRNITCFKHVNILLKRAKLQISAFLLFALMSTHAANQAASYNKRCQLMPSDWPILEGIID